MTMFNAPAIAAAKLCDAQRSPSPHSAFTSLHIPIPFDIYSNEFDAVAMPLIHTFVSSPETAPHIEAYFFVRYVDTGPHLRLRFRLRTGVTAVESQYVQAQLVALAADRGLTASACDYEPEVDRYGGVEAMRHCEQFFYEASTLALACLTPTPISSSRRLGCALIAQLVLAQTVTESGVLAGQMLRTFGSNYLSMLSKDAADSRFVQWNQEAIVRAQKLGPLVIESWRTLEGGGDDASEWSEYTMACRNLVASLRELAARGRLSPIWPGGNSPLPFYSIIASALHMTSNRLGVSILDESLLALAAALVLEDHYA